MNQYYDRAKHKTLDQVKHMLRCLSGSKFANPDAISAYELLIEEKEGNTYTVELEDQEETQIAGAEQHEDYIVSKAYLHKAQSSYRRGIGFLLSFSEFKRLKNKKRCAYTGVKFEEEGQNKLTLDRIDSSLPYTKDNTVACTHAANQIKNNLFEDPVRENIVSVKQVARMIKVLQGMGYHG